MMFAFDADDLASPYALKYATPKLGAMAMLSRENIKFANPRFCGGKCASFEIWGNRRASPAPPMLPIERLGCHIEPHYYL